MKPQCKSTHKKETRKRDMMATSTGVGDFDNRDGVDNVSDDESIEVERRVKTLQRLVPGGENMEVDRLFKETAEYIEALKGQVLVMKSLNDFIEACSLNL